jgi:hypothetical protein
MGGGWTTPADIAGTVRRAWENGSLLRAYSRGDEFGSISVRVHGPKPSQIGDDVSAARDWVHALDAGRQDDRRYTLEWQAIGGRDIGRNMLPVRAWVSSYDQAWALLNVSATVRRFDELLAAAGASPAVGAWIAQNPHKALTLEDEIPRLIAAYSWLDRNRGSGRYLREISAPGVDTKFAERHRATLAAMLDVPTRSSQFLTGLGLKAKPELVRLRPASSLGLPVVLTELAVRPEELAALPMAPATALVIENEVTYLSVDVPVDGLVIWGQGFAVDRVARLPWLANAQVHYWGDIDTHGFAILDRLRAGLPQTRSTLMDRETLAAHRDRWVSEGHPAHATLTRLTPDEQNLYASLVADELGESVRLEQELIDWPWAQERLIALGR